MGNRHWLVRRVERRPPDLVIGGAADPYLRRWYLIPRNPLCNVYLHEILRDDDDRALHDHPWVNFSWILKGSYVEVLFASSPAAGQALPRQFYRLRRRGSWVGRRATTAHRLMLSRDQRGRPLPCWSLFLTGPRLRSWGFWCANGRWVHWRQFTAGERGELVGAGCGE
jgi:hypothetical protein